MSLICTSHDNNNGLWWKPQLMVIWKLNLLDIIADSRRCLNLKRYNWIEVKNGIEGEMAALRSPPNIDLYHNSMEVAISIGFSN